jgi:hypothetical protein
MLARWLGTAMRAFGVLEHVPRHCGILMNAALSRFFPTCFPYLEVCHYSRARLTPSWLRHYLPVEYLRNRQITVAAESPWFAVC